MVDAGETCDLDVPGFHVWRATTCVLPVEAEPDGVAATANGPRMGPALIEGAVLPAADNDGDPVTRSTRAELSLRAWDVFGPITCAPIDTLVDLMSGGGTTQRATDDDGEVLCPRLTPSTDAGVTGQPAGGSYVHLRPFGSTGTFGVRYIALWGDGVATGSEECVGTTGCDVDCQRVPSCGDFFADAPKTCDQGNRVSGDG